MPRVFVAIPLPDETRDRLVAVQPPAIPGIRILGREELHLTLHFLGEVAAQDFDTMRTALATVRVNAFTVAINGIGKFQQEGRPQVLWAGVEANAALIALHRSIGAALADAIGFQPEDRPYSPHITLARINQPVAPEIIEGYLERNGGFGIPSVLVDRFVLYSSNFGENVPHYQEEAVFPLGPASATIPIVLPTSEKGEFIAYLGPAEIHDGIVKSVGRQDASLQVTIRGADGTVISVAFQNVIEVQENCAEGMMIYALAEYRRRGGQRLFVFANWETDDDAVLAVIAEEVTFQASRGGGSGTLVR